MKPRLFVLTIGSVFLFGTFLFSKLARAAIPETGGKFPQYDYISTKYWWRDDTHPKCSQKEFTGAYMYKGLKTFGTQADCQRIAPSTVFNPPTTTPARDVVIGWPKRVLLQVQEFFLNIFVRFFPPSQNTSREVPTKEQPVYNCGGFMGTQCPLGYKCKILGGDAGTCVKSGLFGF